MSHFRRPHARGPQGRAPFPPAAEPSPRRGRRASLLGAFGGVFIAALMLAPGAFASTLSFASGALTYSAGGPQAVEVDFGEPAAGTVEVRTIDTVDPIASVPGNCTATPPTTNTDVVSDYTCTGVTSLVANGGAVGDGLFAQDFTGATPVDPPIADIPVTFNGGDGNDTLVAGTGSATLNGGNGDDTVDGGPGNDVVNGGAGQDLLYGDASSDIAQLPAGALPANADVLNGGDGSDTLYPSNGPNQVSGGAGVDQVVYFDNIDNAADTAIVALPVNVSLDGLANDGYAGNNSNIATDVEDVSVQDIPPCAMGQPCAYGNATLTGDHGPNSLSGGSGDDTITGGGGGDFLSGNAGSNTLNGVNGYPDRLDCGGTGTANADQLDTVLDCTRTNLTKLTNTGLIIQAKAPTISWSSPRANARISPSRSNTFRVNATTGTNPITQVVFYAGGRMLCVDKTAPYSCAYHAIGSDVGKDTLIAIASDSTGLTATTTRGVTVSRFKPSKLTASTRPGTDKKAPYAFTTRGRLTLPSGVTARQGCTGRVSVTFRAGHKKVGTGSARLRSSCRFSLRVEVALGSAKKSRSKKASSQKLKVSVTFTGSTSLTKLSARSYRVKIG